MPSQVEIINNENSPSSKILATYNVKCVTLTTWLIMRPVHSGFSPLAASEDELNIGSSFVGTRRASEAKTDFASCTIVSLPATDR